MFAIREPVDELSVHTRHHFLWLMKEHICFTLASFSPVMEEDLTKNSMLNKSLPQFKSVLKIISNRF
jgi:hypothetical protein